MSAEPGVTCEVLPFPVPPRTVQALALSGTSILDELKPTTSTRTVPPGTVFLYSWQIAARGFLTNAERFGLYRGTHILVTASITHHGTPEENAKAFALEREGLGVERRRAKKALNSGLPEPLWPVGQEPKQVRVPVSLPAAVYPEPIGPEPLAPDPEALLTAKRAKAAEYKRAQRARKRGTSEAPS